MTKQTKMLVGVGILATVGYFVWKSGKKKPAAFANAVGRSSFSTAKVKPCAATSTEAGCKCPGAGGQVGSWTTNGQTTTVYNNPNAATPGTVHFCCGKVPGECNAS